MKGTSRRRALDGAVLAIAASTALAVTLPLSAAAKAHSAPVLVDLRSPQDFTRQFNDDRGHVRLVLLLSPT